MNSLQDKAQYAWKAFQINMEYKELKMFIRGKHEISD